MSARQRRVLILVVDMPMSNGHGVLPLPPPPPAAAAGSTTPTRGAPRPPNGGWGWMVVAGVSVAYMTNMALFSVFSLMYGGQLKAWGLETTGISVINSTMNFVQNFSGLVVGPLVKRLGSKAVSLGGGALLASGMMLSYFATDPWHIFITWGFLVWGWACSRRPPSWASPSGSRRAAARPSAFPWRARASARCCSRTSSTS